MFGQTAATAVAAGPNVAVLGADAAKLIQLWHWQGVADAGGLAARRRGSGPFRFEADEFNPTPRSSAT